MLRPRHFRNVDQALNARSDFNERAVVGHDDNFTLNLVADFQFRVESVPWMRLELLQAEGDALLLVVEVEDNNIEFLVELYNLVRVVDTSPREVGDMNQAVNTTEVDEYAVRSDVLDSTFEHLSFFEFGDDFFLLLFELGLDECLVRNNDILEFLIDFHNLEFHSLAYVSIVVADRLNVDLRARQECLDAEYVDNHTALSAAFDVTLDDFIVGKSLVDAVPAAGSARFFVGKDKLSFFVFLIFDEHLYLVADFQIRVVTEFVHRDDTVRLVADVDYCLTLVQSDYSSFD